MAKDIKRMTRIELESELVAERCRHAAEQYDHPDDDRVSRAGVYRNDRHHRAICRLRCSRVFAAPRRTDLSAFWPWLFCSAVPPALPWSPFDCDSGMWVKLRQDRPRDG